ncbi:MAG: VOC family protein [Polyangiaceae bacterium]|nr:VOC family protein [Polyangiaceae bacterium]
MIRGGLVIYFVRDVEVAVRFYVETLGMKLVEQEPRWSVIDAGDGFRIGLHAAKDAPANEANETSSDTGASISPISPGVTFFSKLPIHQAVAILENRGVSFTVQEIDSGTIANFCDPDGHPLCLYQPK